MRVLVSSVFSLWLLTPVSSWASPSLFLLGLFWRTAVQTGLGNTRGCAWESGAEDHVIYIYIIFTEVFCTQLSEHNVCQASICGITNSLIPHFIEGFICIFHYYLCSVP